MSTKEQSVSQIQQRCDHTNNFTR